MKLVLTVLTLLMLGSLSAQAGGSVTYSDSGTKAPIIEDQVVFPGGMKVDANLVCRAGDTLKTTIPATTNEVCDKMGYQANNSGYMVWTCVQSHTVTVPAQDLVAGLTYQGQECVKTSYLDGVARVPVCDQYATVTENQPLTYRMTAYHSGDYQGWNPYETEGTIQNCQ